jgi:flagellar biosynthetic protein FliP
MAMRSVNIIHPGAVAEAEQGRGTRTFFRHALEMTVAMIVGMVVLGMTFRAIHVAVFGTGFDKAWHDHTELAVFAMTFNMTLPMVLWMRHRGHPWERWGEMAAAMFALAFALLVFLWVGAISDHVVLPLEMALMIPAMIAVMLALPGEYSQPPTAPRRSASRKE